MTRRVLSLKERIAVANEVQVTWESFPGSLRQYFAGLSEKLQIPGLNYDHVYGIMEDLDIPVRKGQRVPSTVLDRLTALESAVAALQSLQKG